MTRRVLQSLPVFAVLGVVGLLVAASGVVPIGARSGHWWITEWFLQFGKRRSVSTHTLFAEPPDLDRAWLVLKGAGHYESGCRPCHGAPDLDVPRVAQSMLPPPPPLTTIARRWDSAELAYIVRHGIKLTGMPAWPADGRDDEVHAVVSFLEAMDGMDAPQYRELVDGETPPDALAALAAGAESSGARLARERCARCHGIDGRGRGNAAFPALAGQQHGYLERALAAYASGERASGIMGPIAAPLDAEQMRSLAAHYAALPAKGPEPVDAARADRGREIATAGVPERRVPICADCHGPSRGPHNPAYPVLSGQYEDYLLLQLELFGKGVRGGSRFEHLMDPAAHGLSAEERRDAAAFYASRGGAP